MIKNKMYELLVQNFTEQEIGYLQNCFSEEEWEQILTCSESFVMSINGPISTFKLNIDLFKWLVDNREQYTLESVGSKRFLISKDIQRIPEHEACLRQIAQDDTLYNPVIIIPDENDPHILVIEY